MTPITLGLDDTTLDCPGMDTLCDSHQYRSEGHFNVGNRTALAYIYMELISLCVSAVAARHIS
ncbi:hypothetical protein JG688_00002021 [Phytophthora aleatoria]|uniref:Uncharacterized protein n=1 Tax=Phytophthora aleatoria TaxID=2496075 RepID=A0A8J5MB27_9STRA|nr:hypothetical protein JG688_00002021 [Phytophthora aleatoria]